MQPYIIGVERLTMQPERLTLTRFMTICSSNRSQQVSLNIVRISHNFSLAFRRIFKGRWISSLQRDHKMAFHFLRLLLYGQEQSLNKSQGYGRDGAVYIHQERYKSHRYMAVYIWSKEPVDYYKAGSGTCSDKNMIYDGSHIIKNMHSRIVGRWWPMVIEWYANTFSIFYTCRFQDKDLFNADKYRQR